jgi:hypothetical protein
MPTVKQLDLLRSLGCRTKPQTKAEAYRLINETLNTKGYNERPAYSHR